MALQKTNVSLNLGNGMDQKSDNKIGPDNQFADMMDWIYQKIGKLYKRFGTNKLSADVVTTYPNPLSIGTSLIPSSQFSYKDQLLVQNKGALYSYYEDQAKWYFKGHHYPLELSTKTTVASELQYQLPTSYYIGDLRVMFYRAYDPVNVATAGYQFKYTVIEQATGNVLVDDETIFNYVPSSNSVQYWQVVSFASKAYLLYNSGASNLMIAEINLTTGVLGTATVLKADMQGPGLNINVTADHWVFSTVRTNKLSVGERVFVAYYNTSNQISIFALTSAGIVDATMGTYALAESVHYGFALEYNDVTDLLFLAYQDSSLNVKVKNYTFTASSITLANTISVATTATGMFYVDLAKSPVNTSEVLLMYNIYAYNIYATASGTEPYLYEATVNSTAVTSGPTMFATGYIIAAKSYTDSTRSTVYSFLQNTIGSQQTFFMIDRIKGKNENALFAQAKWNYGVANWSGVAQALPQISLINSAIYLALPKVIDQVGNPVGGAPSPIPILSDRIGICETFIELQPEQSASSTFLGDAVHTSGGYLGYYDGSNFVESSYFLNPELMEIEAFTNSAARMTATVTQQGVNGLPEISHIIFGNGANMELGPTYYWTFDTTTTKYVVWYSRAGSGTAPTVAGTKVQVDVSAGDAGIDVRNKTKAAILAYSPAATLVDYSGTGVGFDITNTSFGVVPDIYTNMNPSLSCVVSTTQQGTNGTPEITNLAFTNGPQQLTGPTYYWTFNTFTTAFVVYYVIDGIGSAPVVAGTKIAVNINSTDSSFTVAYKTYAALLAAASGYTLIYANNIVTIINSSGGTVTDASTANYIGPAIIGGLDAGAYQYCAVWTYFDVNGQVIKSAPSVPVSITVTSGQFVSISAWNPLLTNRLVGTIRTEWYRTKKNGTVFYKISSLAEDKAWAVGVPSAGFLDIKTDSAITASPELLYTNGGVLENYQIPAVKQVSVFKNRIIATGVDDPTVLYYSKTAIYGAPVEFAAENFIQIDIDSDPITGHAQLDDKLIIFKEKKVYYMAGDGANDLGQGSSFTLPTLIATDVGCISHNSIVKTPHGLMFKSQKGIYLLDRALQLTYIGKEVEDYNSETTMNGLLLSKDNQVRFTLKSGYTLVYDYLFNRWTAFSQYGGDRSTIWKDKFARVDNTGRTYVENKALWVDSGSTVESYSPTVTTKWLQVKDIQNYSRIYRLAILADLKSKHTLNYKIYYDYDLTNYDEYNFDSSNIAGAQYDDTVYQPIIHLKRQKCDAMMVELTVVPVGESEECLELVDMSFTVGLKEGLQKVKADKKL